MKHRGLTAVFGILCILAVCVFGTLGLTACNDDPASNDGSAPSDAYADWMGYVKEDTLYRDIIIPATHNSGTVDSLVFGDATIGHLEVLDCQQGTIYDQLMYGVRSFDFRITTNYDDTPRLVCTHGTGFGLYFDDALRDIARFLDEHPTEFVTMTVKLYDSNFYSKVDPDKAQEAISILEPEKYCMDDGYDLPSMTLAEIRESGKRIAISCPEGWCDYINTSWVLPETYTYEVNSGPIEQGRACYDNIWNKITAAGEEERLCISLQRGYGNSDGPTGKIAPFKYMNYDREFFLELIEKIKVSEHALTVCGEFDIDYATYDYVQCGSVLGLNVAKGIVNDGESFLAALEEKMALPPVDKTNPDFTGAPADTDGE